VRVVVPAVAESRHLPAVESALRLSGVRYAVETLGAADDAYWALLAGLWDEGEGFLVIEHDIVIRPTTIHELVECPEPWCCAPYPYMGGKGTIIGLGCTKFSTELIAAVPDALARAGEMTDLPRAPDYPVRHDHPPKHWCRLDSRLQRALVDSGSHPHFDHDPVEHLNSRGPSHGCR
jgi:hypothetical protein